MSTGQKFYITTSIAYTNAPPHIGFALELCQADAVARYHRLRGDDVFFLTGTDEHGRKVAQAASDAHKEPRAFVDELAAKFQELTVQLDISRDYFIRTSDQKTHWPGAQAVWRLLAERGKLYKKNYRGLYCEGCEAFKKPSDLQNGKCPDHNREPEAIEEENWFFRLSDYQNDLAQRIAADELRIIPNARKNEILAFIAQGLEDVSFSRPSKDLSWGVPVPEDPTQTMYVWCDALTNYLTGIGYPADRARFEKFWPADLHIIGKDILRFHAAIWPAMLLAIGLPLPKAILVHGHILAGGKKMSKSLGNVIDPFEMIEQYGADALRYYLLHDISTTGDGDFTKEHFAEVYQADLANGIGNLLARTLALGEKHAEPVSPRENSLRETVRSAWQKYEHAWEAYDFPAALGAPFGLVAHANEYIDKEKPWELMGQSSVASRTPPALNLSNGHVILANLVFLLGNIAWMLKPFLPATAGKILVSLGLREDDATEWEGRALTLKRGEQLFPRK